MTQKFQRVSRILGCHDIDLPEYAERPERDVFEVAYGRGDHVEDAFRHAAPTGPRREEDVLRFSPSLYSQELSQFPVGLYHLFHVVAGELPAVFAFRCSLELYPDRFLRLDLLQLRLFAELKPLL